MRRMEMPHNIYIHTPFCMSKCKYCAFFSAACTAPDWDRFADGIVREIQFWGMRLGRVAVPTVFFGGGTPSLMPTRVFARIMNTLRNNFNIVPNPEITLESNPKTLDATRLREFMDAGVNRLSVGVQRLDNPELEFLGRRHNVRDAMQLLDVAMKMGLRVNADFIYGIPGDNADTVAQMCRDINALGLGHVSMYELTIEKNTPFGQMNLAMPSNDAMADMYCTIAGTLALPRYEVSNYAKPGNECIHNQNVWDGDAYVGIGRGAAGRPYIDGTWYEQRGGDDIQMQPLTPAARATEKIITGLRTVRGVRKSDDVMRVINTDWLRANPELVCDNNDRICVTEKGMLILDDLLLDLCNWDGK